MRSYLIVYFSNANEMPIKCWNKILTLNMNIDKIFEMEILDDRKRLSFTCMVTFIKDVRFLMCIHPISAFFLYIITLNDLVDSASIPHYMSSSRLTSCLLWTFPKVVLLKWRRMSEVSFRYFIP